VRARGFTLLELLVVVAIMALATAGVALSLRDSAETQLEREAQRLAALLESGRAQARMASVVVRWHTTPTGFAFEGLPGTTLPTQWLGADVQATTSAPLVLGPDPIIGPQQVRLVSISSPARSVTLATDGIRPFSVTPPPGTAP
jgi:general secretion pathway protein H